MTGNSSQLRDTYENQKNQAIHWWNEADEKTKEIILSYITKMIQEEEKCFTYIGLFAQIGFMHIAMLAEQQLESN